MQTRKKISLLFSAFLIIVAGGLSLLILQFYNMRVESEKTQLENFFELQKTVITSIVKSDSLDEKSINILHSAFSGLKDTDPCILILAFERQDKIRYIVAPEAIVAEPPIPVKRALRGESGVYNGINNTGHRILAAYGMIEHLRLGIVTRISLEEILTTFQRATAVMAAIVILLLISGNIFFLRSRHNSIKHIELYANSLFKDLTEKNEEVKQEKIKFESLVSSVSDGIMIVNNKGKVLFVNQALSRITGIPHEELANNNGLFLAKKFIKPKDLLRTLPLIKKLYNGQPINLDLEYNDKLFHISVPSVDLGKNYITTIIKDVTDYQRAENRRKSNETLLEMLLESAPDAIIISNTNGEMVTVNNQTEILFGYDRNELVGEVIEMLIPARFSDHVSYRNKYYSNPATRKMSSGNTASLYGKRKDNTEIPVSIGLSSIVIDNERLVFSIIRDVSDVVKREEDLNTAFMKVQQALEIKNNFLANMTHEVRTPLNGIMGSSAMIKIICESEDRDELMSATKNLEESSQRLLRTMNEILDIAQLSTDTYKTHYESLDVVNIVGEIFEKYAHVAKDKYLNYSYDNTSGSYKVEIDRYTFTQAIDHLINNAVNYTHEGGVYVLLYTERGDLKIVIKDSGAGIDKEYIDHLFDLFTQETEGFGKHNQGIGLGLSLVKYCLDLNHFSIHLDSDKGEGTSITLTRLAPK